LLRVQVAPPLGHVHPVPAIDTRVIPVGAFSVTVTVPLVGPAPFAFDTVRLYVAPFCPWMKLPTCVLVMLRLAHSTVVVALDCTELLLPAEAVAVFEYAAQLEVEVALVTCTEAEAPAARTPMLQPNVWLPTAPATEHVPGPL
jgi:hypothetical protein